jgi:uncharacterized protein Smg (DUF494 family)
MIAARRPSRIVEAPAAHRIGARRTDLALQNGVVRITMMPVAAQDVLPCVDPRGTMTIRVLGPHERGRFAPEAWGHLLALSGAGALDPAELEQVIERAMLQFDGRIALDDLRSMMEGAGYDDPGASADSQTVH